MMEGMAHPHALTDTGRAYEFATCLPGSDASVARWSPEPAPRVSAMLKLLCVTDQIDFAASAALALTQRGFEVRLASDSLEARAMALSQAPDVVVINPSRSPRATPPVVETLRACGLTVPVIPAFCASQTCDAADDPLEDAGTASAYFDGLAARARTQAFAGAGRAMVRLGDLCVQMAPCAIDQDGRELALTYIEGRLLAVLMSVPGQVVSKATISDEVFKRRFHRASNFIDVHISRLRTKLAAGSSRTVIRTLKTEGYVLAVRC